MGICRHYGMEKHNPQYIKKAGNIVHCRVSDVGPRFCIADWGGAGGGQLLSDAVQQQQRVSPHMSLAQDTKIQSMVPTECMLLLHHRKVKKL